MSSHETVRPRGAPHRTRLVQDVIDHSRAAGPAHHLLLVMAQVTEHGQVWMRPERLAAAARMSPRSMYEARAALVKLGEIRTVEKGGGRGRQAVYELEDLQALYSATPRSVSEAPNSAETRSDSGAKLCENSASPVRAREPRSTTTTDEADASSVMVELFDHWRTSCHHERAVLSPDRRAKIAARLREGAAPEEIRTAIDGAARAAYVDGSGVRHDDLTLICRSRAKLDLFIARASAAATNGNGQHSEREERRARGAGALERLQERAA